MVLCAGDSPQPLKIAHFPHFALKQEEGEGFILWLLAKTHSTKENVTFVPLLSFSPILGLEMGGKSLKLVQTISWMSLLTLPSEGKIKNEMMDPGSLKHWEPARAQHLLPDQGPVLVSQGPRALDC